MTRQAATHRPGRAARLVIWTLSRLLPQGFQARQQAEWSGDLVALAGSGAAARWRYLFAALLTLPALRAHARKPGAVGMGPVMPPSVPASVLARIIVGGLGSAVVAWLLAMPGRYYLMDFPYRLSDPGVIGLPFDPKDTWPVDGPWFVPLWIVLGAGSYVFVIGWVALVWLGLAAMLLGPTKRGAKARHRLATAMIGAAVIAIGVLLGLLGMGVQWRFLGWNDGASTAVIGGLSVAFGVMARRLPRRTRTAVLVAGFMAIAIHLWYYTPIGSDMLNWYYD